MTATMFEETMNNAETARAEAPPEAGVEDFPGEMTPFAADVFAKQPFKGYALRTALAGTERTAVFKAHDAAMERAVVVKTLRPCRERDGVTEEFFSLAGSIARLRCPGVARGLDAGRGDGNFFLVYEYVRGETLAARLARLHAGRLTERDSLRVVADIAAALQSLFDSGHSHGRLTPANCVQTAGGKVKLTDIGFSWTAAWRTDEEAFLASPDWLSPEAIGGECNIDVRGDLYSLGCMWFRMLAGRRVFEGATPAETLEMHVKKKPEQLHRLDEKITESTSTLVRWLLEKERDARPRTPKEFLRKLSRHPLLAGGQAEGGEGEEEAGAEAPEAVLTAEEEVALLIDETKKSG